MAAEAAAGVVRRGPEREVLLSALSALSAAVGSVGCRRLLSEVLSATG